MLDIEIVEGESPLKVEPQQVDQRSEEWFALRLGKITGSRFPKLMNSSKKKIDEFTDSQLTILKELAVERMTGERTDFYSNKYMEWGTETEPLAIAHYEGLNWCKVQEVGFYPFGDFGDSPDGITEDRAIEVKCPKSTTHLDYLIDPKKLFNTYKWQCYGHMIATGLKQCDLISYDPRFTDEAKRMVIYNIQFEQEEADKLMERLNLCEAKIKEFCNA
ncbi:MAG: lambda exonuclease family protein [Cyclobacteriaceae bacterium]